jgi:hypothetical protein
MTEIRGAAMACDDWRERLIESVCEEIESAAADGLAAHIAACAACRTEIDALHGARRLLHDAAGGVPAPLRVVVLREPARAPAAWLLAAGIAGLGLVAGLALSWSWQARQASAHLARELASPGRSQPPAAQPASLPAREILDEWIDASVARRLGAAPVGGETVTPMTRAEVEALMGRLGRRFERDRAADLQYVLDEVAGLEARTTLRLGETQQAIRYVASRSDPRLSEQ